MSRRFRIFGVLLVAGAGTSVYALLGAQGPGPGSLDVVFRRFPLSWETGAAVLWPLLVVRPALGAPGAEPTRAGRRSAFLPLGILTGWLGLLGCIGLGALGGVVASAAVRGWPTPGDPAVPLAMAATLTALYLLGSALGVGARHPWRWLAGLYLVPNGLAPLLAPMREAALLEPIWTWVSVGRLGPGTLLEAPALVGGLVLEPEWRGIDPWTTIAVWLLVALGILGLSLRRRLGPGWGDRPRAATPAVILALVVSLAACGGGQASPEGRAPTTPAGAPIDVVEAQLRAFNAHDAGAVAALVSDDFVWLGVRGDSVAVEARGRAALRASMEDYFASVPSVRSSIEASFASGPYVAVRERARWRGADGRTRSQASLAVYEVASDRIRRVWYFPALER